jgi:hypothetical protein
MTIEPGSEAAFAQYKAPLELLETAFSEAFCKTDDQIDFVCAVTPGGQKFVHILYNGRTNAKQFIEADSPAQAIKDVAKAVRL